MVNFSQVMRYLLYVGVYSDCFCDVILDVFVLAEYSDSELEGFKAWFDLHSNNYTTLKQQCDKLASEKSFAWHQYGLMENDFKIKLKSKNSELEQANAKIQTLLASMEQLQSSNNEKDDKIGILISKVAKMETDSNKLKEEISKLSKDLDLLRNVASTSSTPVLNRCTTRARGKSSAKDKINVTVKKDLSAAQLTQSTKETKKVLPILFLSSAFS